MCEVAGMTVGSQVSRKKQVDPEEPKIWQISAMTDDSSTLEPMGITQHTGGPITVPTNALITEWRYVNVKMPVEIIGWTAPYNNQAWIDRIFEGRVRVAMK